MFEGPWYSQVLSLSNKRKISIQGELLCSEEHSEHCHPLNFCVETQDQAGAGGGKALPGGQIEKKPGG